MQRFIFNYCYMQVATECTNTADATCENLLCEAFPTLGDLTGKAHTVVEPIQRDGGLWETCTIADSPWNQSACGKYQATAQVSCKGGWQVTASLVAFQPIPL